MLSVNEILTVIERKAGVNDYRLIPLYKFEKCQNHSLENFVPLNQNINLDKDMSFQNFYNYLNSIFSNKVRLTTAKKIFSNAYFYMF